MDNESDIFSVDMPQKIMQKIPLDAGDYAIDYPFSMAANNTSSDFVQVTIKKFKIYVDFLFDLGVNCPLSTSIKFVFCFYFQLVDASLMDENFNDSMAYSQLLRHSSTISIIYCIAYTLVFSVGLVGNLFVISVVFRVPRMRTVTNLFIANLAIADVLVIVFCVPATLMSNLFVRKYRF